MLTAADTRAMRGAAARDERSPSGVDADAKRGCQACYEPKAEPPREGEPLKSQVPMLSARQCAMRTHQPLKKKSSEKCIHKGGRSIKADGELHREGQEEKRKQLPRPANP